MPQRFDEYEDDQITTMLPIKRTLEEVPEKPEAELISLRFDCEAPPFDPVKMLPADLPDLQAFLNAVAESLQVPIDMVGAVAVGLVALAGSRSVEVECMPGWREPLTLWFLSLLRPGERKSAAVSALLRPIHEWTKGERKRLSEPLARCAEKRRGMEQELTVLRAGAAKPKNTEASDRMRGESFDLAAKLDAMPVRLCAPDLIVQGFTPEALRDALEMNGEKLGIVSAECDAAELMGARYSDAPNIDLLLSAHAGDEITTKRAGGKTIQLERPSVAMVLAVQPEAVLSVLSEKFASGRGLTDRMLLIIPVSRMGNRLLDPPLIPAHLSKWWSERIHAILDLPWPGRVIIGYDGEPVRCTSSARVVSLSAGAHDYLWALRADIEQRLRKNGDLVVMSGFASKLPGACARIALTFALLRDPKTEVVGAEDMRAACDWAPYLLAHRKKILGEAIEPTELHHARRLWEALRRSGRPIMTGRDLFRMIHDSAMPDMKAFGPVLLLMEDHGAIRRMPDNGPTPGRPAERYAVHPALLPDQL